MCDALIKATQASNSSMGYPKDARVASYPENNRTATPGVGGKKITSGGRWFKKNAPIGTPSADYKHKKSLLSGSLSKVSAKPKFGD